MSKRLQILLLIGVCFGAFLIVTLRSQISAQTTTPKPPSLWTNLNVGTVKLAGTLAVTGGRRDIVGAGFGIQGTEDSMNFTHRPLFGDGEIVARVVLNESSRGAAKAGVMIRQSLDADSICAAVSVTPSNGIAFQWRARVGDPSLTEIARAPRWIDSTNRVWKLKSSGMLTGSSTNAVRLTAAPKLAGRSYWVKLVRQGKAVSAWSSHDGKDWKWHGTQEIDMPRRVFAGLSVNSQNGFTPASARFADFKVRAFPAAQMPAPPSGTGTGLRVFYYDLLAGNVVTQLSAAIDCNWASKPPLAQLGKGAYSVRWSGFIEPQYSELHALHLDARGGVRLWINNRKVIDHWHGAPDGELRTTIFLEAGKKYPIRLEYADEGKNSRVRLSWSSPSLPKQVIRPGQMYPSRLEPVQPVLTALMEVAAAVQLPAPWQHRDIGRATLPRTVARAGGGFFVESSGFDIGGNADAFTYLWQPWSGQVEIIARVEANSVASPGARAGVMIRESLAPDAANVSLTVSAGSGIKFEHRRKASTATVVGEKIPAGDTWVRLVQRRENFTAYTSSDGVNWNWRGKLDVAFPTNVYVGLAVCARKHGQCYGAQFDPVIVRVPTTGPRPPVGTGDGLRARYSDVATTNLVVRTDPRINFAWDQRSPVGRIGRTNFTVRWQGVLEAQHSEPYDLHLISAGGARVWLGGRLVIDDMKPHFLHERKARVSLLAGHLYALQVEYHSGPKAHVRLFWSGPSTPLRLIPQSQLYSPAHPEYKKIADKDGDGMPDAWERRYGLNEFDAADANADPDNDGLMNLQEFRAGTDPFKKDTDGDGLPDGWEVRFALKPLDGADAAKDRDNDGLSNLEEFQAGTDPFKRDTDRDGLSDFLEVRETRTNPLLSDTLGVKTVAEVSGAKAVWQLGRWTVEGDTIFAEDRRGAVEYVLSVPKPDMYRLQIVGGSHVGFDANRDFDLLVSVDGEYLGRSVLTVPKGSNGVAIAYTPWLQAGEHRIRLYWDNVAIFRSLQVVALRLQSIRGAKVNENGVSEWVEKRLQNTCSVDGGANGVIASLVSPACVEGRGGYLSMMAITDGITPQAGAGARWYANVPLKAGEPRAVVCSFQNGGLLLTNQVVWQPVNLLTAADLVIRKGDSLLLTATQPGETKGQSRIEVAGVANYTLNVGEQVTQLFEKAGEFTVTGRHVSSLGAATERSVKVKVVEASFEASPAAWASKRRSLDAKGIPLDVTLESDARVLLERNGSLTNGGSRLQLTLDAEERRTLVARTGTNGLIAASTRAEGFRVYSANEVSFERLALYPDGSQLYEMGFVVSPRVPGVVVRVNIHVGGITFDDGTVTKELTEKDFDELGQAFVRFLRPATARTSTCHRTTAWQGDVFLGEH